jgi:hypothetical protein
MSNLLFLYRERFDVESMSHLSSPCGNVVVVEAVVAVVAVVAEVAVVAVVA